ncbi:uncharacterized protein PFLUO_LOCUS218 [Penicillium psychrofluorescens]|uniref:uncharacterized protein n=1 Tax=Penicillium psychrofluorescens TaxID=3158075 RepID=UPI003CCCB9EC
MSLQVNDPRSRTRSKSRERSRSRDSRAPSPSPSRPRDRSPAVEIAPSSRRYDPDDDAEIDRQYKLMKERQREVEEPRASNVVSRAPRSPARYDVRRSDSEDEEKYKRRERTSDKSSRARRNGSYDHSDSEEDVKYVTREPGRRPSSPRGRDSHSRPVDSDSDSVDGGLAYGDDHGGHPSYARPNKYQYAQPSNYLYAQPGAPRQPAYPEPPSDWAPIPECERPGFVPPSSHPGEQPGMPGGFPPASTYADASGTAAPAFPQPHYATLPHQQPIPYSSGGAGYAPSHYRSSSSNDVAHPPPSQYAQPAQFQYAQVDPNVRYSSKTASKQSYTASPQEQYDMSPPEQPIKPYRYSSQPQFVEIKPGGSRSSGRPHSLSVSTSNNLAAPGANHAHGPPPASPLLEPYHGTYQSMSPMPSPIVMPSAHHRDDDISDVEPLDDISNSESGRHKKNRTSISEKDGRHRGSKDKSKEKEKDERRDDKRRSRPSAGRDRHDSASSVTAAADGIVTVSPTTGRKRVSFYDAGADAAAMQAALTHTRSIDYKPIIQILPRLNNDEMAELRQEYKNKVKLHGKGINLAKHIKHQVQGSATFNKVCYATALGRWESEAYWANCYYQAGTSRRELLIESLMGRSNSAIREIKNCFRDSRYADSLERCMRSELRADKFRTAVLLALEARRQDEREPLDPRLCRRDVQDLHQALVSREGGETAMIEIIVLRSDAHLREVLRAYESAYGHNFARAMIAKSRNLVGETLAHILNGAINRPMRDALLLHQALRESRSGRERSELLISRLVRLHWEPRHLEQVKTEYRRRYGERLEEAIAEEVITTSGGSEWGEFCIELSRSSSSSSSS